MKNLNQSLLETLFEQLADAVYLIDPATSNILWCNIPGYRDLGLSHDEVINHSVLSLQKDVQNLPQWQEIKAVIESDSPFTFIGRHAHKDGSEMPVEVNTTCFQFEEEDYFLSVARNISKRITLEMELQSKQHRLWFALNKASDGIWEWDIHNRGVFFSQQLKKMLGYGPDEMRPVIETWKESIHPEDYERVQDILTDHLDGRRERYEAEYRLKNRSGHYIWVHDRGVVCARDKNGNATHVAGMVRNITDTKKLQFQLDKLASKDFLTNLYNRRKGEEFAEQQISQANENNQPFTLMILDLDHFKKINDLFGHNAGDNVLIKVAKLLEQIIADPTRLFRWGGEEFILLFPNTDCNQAQQIQQQIHQAFQNNRCELDEKIKLTISLGIACTPENGTNFKTLFKEADRALYLAKENGRNQTRFAE